MTTVSGTSSAAYVAPTTTSTTTTTPATTDASSTASTTSATAYDGTAAVAQAQALAAQEISAGASGSSGSLLGLSPDILSLLQGGSGTSDISTLLGGGSGNAFFSAQSLTALYGAQQARNQASQATDPIDALIASNNAVLNANTTASLAASKAAVTPASTDTTGTDTTA